MDKEILNIYNLLQGIAWHFGSHGINGECCGELSLAEFMALKKIYENNNFSVQDIGNAINFTKSGATRIIDRLENRGYVVRENSPVDARVCCVSITVKGKEAVMEILGKYTLYLKDALKELEPQEIEHISEALKVLVNAVLQCAPCNSPVNAQREG